MAVEGCAMRDQAEAFAALTGVIDRDARGDLVGARRDVHRPVIGDGGIDRGLDCGGVVMGAVAECAVTPHIEPGMAGAHQHVAIQRCGAGRRQGREIAGRLRLGRGHEPGGRDQKGDQGDGRCKDIGEPHSCVLLIPGRWFMKSEIHNETVRQ